jgi:hypothetical protein
MGKPEHPDTLENKEAPPVQEKRGRSTAMHGAKWVDK